MNEKNAAGIGVEYHEDKTSGNKDIGENGLAEMIDVVNRQIFIGFHIHKNKKRLTVIWGDTGILNPSSPLGFIFRGLENTYLHWKQRFE